MEEEINTAFKVSRKKWKYSMIGVLWFSKGRGGGGEGHRGLLDSDPGFQSRSDCLVDLFVGRLEIKILDHAWV